MGTKLLERLEKSAFAKAGMAIAVFGMILTGWAGLQHYRERSASLPNPAEQPSACTLWFVGSSSIHRWTSLEKDMAPWRAFNRGIDGALYEDIMARFANTDREPKPAAIILYAGENDIATGASSRTTMRNLAAFLDLRSRIMGHVPVVVLSMKPSPGRRKNLGQQQLFNSAARHLLLSQPNAHFGNITAPLLAGGKMGDNYRADGIHMNAAGYRIWAKLIRLRLREMLPKDVLQSCDPV